MGNSSNKPKLKIIKTIPTGVGKSIESICILKDKRLVSADWDGLIVVYNKSYQPQFQIQKAHNEGIASLCVLRNGLLVSSGFLSIFSIPNIKVWVINEDDYELIHTLKEHTDRVTKVIELEDGKLCSCSHDKTIKIWDNSTYQSITTLQGHTDLVKSIIETNEYIVSVGWNSDDGLRIWNKYTYEYIKQIKNVRCYWSNILEKLNNNRVLLGGYRELNVVDIESSKVNYLIDNTLGNIYCLKVIKDDLVLVGNDKREICEYNPSSNKIISKIRTHNGAIRCLIENEEHELISCSDNNTINIYQYE